jgi:hypothetical protein
MPSLGSVLCAPHQCILGALYSYTSAIPVCFSNKIGAGNCGNGLTSFPEHIGFKRQTTVYILYIYPLEMTASLLLNMAHRNRCPFADDVLIKTSIYN